MNILLLGSGGREHAFAWKLKQSALCTQLFIAPGNAGTQALGTNLPINPNDFGAIKKVVLDYNIQLMIVGPEEPLVRGIYDYFKEDPQLENIPVIGPSAEGARLEGSKAFAKAFMGTYQIPTAAYKEFTAKNLEEGLAFIAQSKLPIVLKADGLAAGKGVLILNDLEQAQQEFKAMLEGKFGAASKTVVIEEFLDGIEFSVFVLTDGKDYKILPVAKDYKRIGEADTGLNTGGMGSVSPVPFVDEALMKKVEERIIQPTIHGIADRAMRYQGFIFFGLIAVAGEPYVIEYNCRMGDPETQVVFPRLKNDLVTLCISLANGGLKGVTIQEDPRVATAVILVSGGYPQAYEKGKTISGIEEVQDSLVFHAGVKEEEGQLLTNGGRVLALSSFGASMDEALEKSNTNAKRITFEGKYFRGDIGFDL